MTRNDGSGSLVHQAGGVWGTLGAKALRHRWFARAPIRVFDAGLGALFGGRLLMIEHMGRRSGLSRRVVLEVVDRPSTGTYLVASGFGAKSQWLRNIESDPNVRVWVGRRRAVPATTWAPPHDEAAAAVTRYARQHPLAWIALRPVFEATLGAPVSELPLVAVQIALSDLPPASSGPAASGSTS